VLSKKRTRSQRFLQSRSLFILFMKIDIVIATYNARESLKRCLNSILRYTDPSAYELIIVDDHSTDGTGTYLRQFQKKFRGKLNIIFNRSNLGTSRTANIALRNTTGEYIVLLDDDTEVTAGWLEGLYSQIKNRANVGLVGAKIVYPDGKIHSAGFWPSSLTSIGKSELDQGQRDYVRECEVLARTCWMLRRELLETVGYFEEKFSSLEDADYCLRIRLGGYKIIYNGKVRIIHYILFRHSRVFWKNKMAFLRKWKTTLKKFPLKDSHPADKFMASGIEQLGKKRFRDALLSFNKMRKIGMIFSESCYIGMALKGLGRLEEAVSEFKKALLISPTQFLSIHNLVLLYRQLGRKKELGKEVARLSEAMRALKEYVFEDPFLKDVL
jgi:GT2 family glycosyltransferase